MVCIEVGKRGLVNIVSVDAGTSHGIYRRRGGYEPRAVEVSERVQGNAILKSGVRAGERVVASGAY